MATDAKDLEQAKQIEEAHATADNLWNDGDRAPFFLTASGTFRQGTQKAFELLFNVPADGDFFATRFNLYLAVKRVSTSDPNLSDRAYKAVDWTVSADRRAGSGTAFPLAPTMASALFDIRGPDGAYSNLPLTVASAFSARRGLPMAFSARASALVSAYPVSGLAFAVDELMRRGTATTVKVTPTFSRRAAAGSAFVLEYRVQGVFTGFKRVKAFVGAGFPFTLTR